MSKKLEKLYATLVAASEDNVLRNNQLRNFKKVVNAPLPKKKADKLWGLMAGYTARASEAENKFYEALDKYRKALPKAKAKVS